MPVSKQTRILDQSGASGARNAPEHFHPFWRFPLSGVRNRQPRWREMNVRGDT